MNKNGKEKYMHLLPVRSLIHLVLSSFSMTAEKALVEISPQKENKQFDSLFPKKRLRIFSCPLLSRTRSYSIILLTNPM